MRLAGDFDYDAHGNGYAQQRRADPRIAARIHDALGDAKTVLNVGAGAGSYEPRDRYVLAVEPSRGMRAQRPRASFWSPKEAEQFFSDLALCRKNGRRASSSAVGNYMRNSTAMSC